MTRRKTERFISLPSARTGHHVNVPCACDAVTL